MRQSSVRRYASERTAKQVVGGLDRRKATARHTDRAAPSNELIAAPMAVSSWYTGGEVGSRGSTVLLIADHAAGREHAYDRLTDSAQAPAG